MNRLPLNSDLFIEDYKVTSISPSWTSRSASGKTNARSQEYQYYKGSVTLYCRTPKAIGQLIAFVESREGKVNPFYLKLPEFKLTDIAGNPVVSTKANVQSSIITTSGYDGWLIQGSKFTINGDTKVYTLLGSSPVDKEVKISPRLRTEVSALSPLNFEPEYYCRLSSDSFTLNVKNTTKTLRIKLDFEEVL